MWKITLFLSCIAQSAIGWEITKITTPEISIPHSASWDDDTRSFYFVNFVTSGAQSSIFRYCLIDGIFYSAYIDGVSSPSFIVPINKKACKKCNKCGGKLFAVGIDHDVVIVKWNGKSTKAKIISSIFSVENDDPLIRYDVAVADSSGRLYAGSLSQTLCNATASRSLYRYTKTAGVDRLFGGLKSTAGIAFNEKSGKMYHLDACQRFLTEFDYDPETGDICNGRVIFEYPLNGIPINTNLPFGLAIDLKGILYFSVYTGSVWKFNPWTSTVIDVIELPVAGALGLAFGGIHRDILYVITGSVILDALSLSIVKEITDGSSIYAITNLDSEGPPSTQMDVK